MCLLVVAWKSHPRYRLILAANRDEFHERPAAALAWWQDEPRILAGRDLRGSGTWMGVARSGRFGTVTNFRDLEAPPAPDAPSRGDLVTRFLTGATSPKEYLDDLRGRAPRYAGFNLLLGGPRALYYFTNRNGLDARLLPAGIYGLSNHRLDSPWPKLMRTRSRLSELVRDDRVESAALFDLLADRAPADPDEIPDTGLPPDWERALSAPFVVHDRYGTRCSTLLLVERNGHTTMLERRFDESGALTGSSRMAFDSMDVPERWLDNEDAQDAGLQDTSALHRSFDTSAE
jgi:uncharacterized protein with NRDE domain